MSTERTDPREYDVIVVGYGPTGMVLAPLLAQAGHRVAVLERFAGLYNLPRAATFDDETQRIMQKLGLGDAIAAGTRPVFTYDWTNGTGDLLDRHIFAESGISGWPEFNMVYQPWLEDQLDALGRSLPGIDILHEHRVTGLVQHDDHVSLSVETPDGPKTINAEYVVGSDGGNSTIRELLGIESDDYGFREPWLVCDFRLTHPMQGLPQALQLGDPAGPVSIFSIDDEHQRFAFMLDGANEFDELTEADVWHKVARWLTPEDAEPLRIATYTFRSRSAQQWRVGRVLLAGDAAHEMPPFLGQGMCSGIRDANNLAWKLDLVLSGRAAPSILDTYQQERAPHVEKITRKAIEMGRLQTIRDPELARARDEWMLRALATSGAPAAYAFPGYDDGFFSAESCDHGTGVLFPQGFVTGIDQAPHRLDDLFGTGFHLVTTDAGVLGDEHLAAAARGGLDVFVLTSRDDAARSRALLAEEPGVHVLTDADGRYLRWFEANGCSAALVRPDSYVFGTTRDADGLTAVLAELAELSSLTVG
ncbi:bifunctional 3-(3-hydroxy-phenyl)propionate/3-hydroxycinnamic acid hydroxylase MhpA [Subtercola lobariae]|uniref:3-(3-hydroxyphenyl)propionate hydroxylase n=1 Tax=Subtercola lobariae TaxID=1588641 RepID=A0A917B1Q8_9MICO|nr:bifunctional 3-(3-hydroxy-phenyl)propionate/3-hydroxycinnamic acid hydroxylase [Subtercola lobariae]GGF13655.1 3-(3-hydroxyphenyl)propionate hydroxylase [Subtercola lobariae]